MKEKAIYRFHSLRNTVIAENTERRKILMQYAEIEKALEELKNGKIILVTDDPEREKPFPLRFFD